MQLQLGQRIDLPTRHPPQRLHTPINISLTLQQCIACMLDRLSLSMQIRQRTRPNSLRIIRQRLTSLQSLRAAIQSLRSTQQLLSLLKLHIAGIVRIAGTEQGGAIVG
jgi:hypothetical protein